MSEPAEHERDPSWAAGYRTGAQRGARAVAEAIEAALDGYEFHGNALAKAACERYADMIRGRVAAALAEPDPPGEQANQGSLPGTAEDRVMPDSFVVYPTDYHLIPYSDRDNWALTVENGHTWGWRIVPGIGRSGGSQVLNRAGECVFEVRADEANRDRRWSMAEALAIALDVVDTKHAVQGMTAAQAVAHREQILASFERVPAAPEGGGETGDDGNGEG